MMRLLKSIACVAFVLGLASTLQAQTIFVTPYNTGSVQGWTFTPVISVSQTFDTNVTIARDRSSDAVASLAPSGTITYDSPMRTMNAGYSGSRLHYFTFSSLDAFDKRAFFNFHTRVSRHWSFFVDTSLAWTPTTDTPLLTGLPFVRVGSRVRGGQAGVTGQLSKRVSMTIGSGIDFVDFDQSSPLTQRYPLFGGVTKTAYANVARQLNQHLSLGVRATAQRTRLNVLGLYNMQNLEGTVDYRFSQVLDVNGGLGVARVARLLPGIAPRIGASFHVGATYKLDKYTDAFANFGQAYTPSYGFFGTMRVREFDTGLRIPIALQNRLMAGGGMTWRQSDFQAPTAFWLNLNTTYAVAPWLRVEAFWGRSTQDVVIDRNQLGVQVVALAPLRFK